MLIPLLTFHLLLFSVTSIAAVLYGGVPDLSGAGFLSLSPGIDCVVYALLGAVAAGIFLFWLVRNRETALTGDSIPPLFRLPGAYGVTLFFFSCLITVLGMAGLFDHYNDIYLPFLLYILLFAALTLLAGFFSCRLAKGRRADLIWLGGLLLLFMFLLWSRITTLTAEDAYWLAELGSETIYEPGYTARIMDSWEGAVIGRLNIHGSVLLGSYEDSYFRGIHAIPREELSVLCTLLPPVLFGLGWAVGAGRKANAHHQ